MPFNKLRLVLLVGVQHSVNQLNNASVALTDCHTLIGVKMVKCVEGQYNKAFLLTMNNGVEVIAKLPNPNAGPEVYTTASEVATCRFVSAPAS